MFLALFFTHKTNITVCRDDRVVAVRILFQAAHLRLNLSHLLFTDKFSLEHSCTLMEMRAALVEQAKHSRGSL